MGTVGDAGKERGRDEKPPNGQAAATAGAAADASAPAEQQATGPAVTAGDGQAGASSGTGPDAGTRAGQPEAPRSPRAPDAGEPVRDPDQAPGCAERAMPVGDAQDSGAPVRTTGARPEPAGQRAAGGHGAEAPGEEPGGEYDEHETRPGVLQVLRAGDTVAVAALALAITSIVGSRVLETLSLTLLAGGPSTDAGPGDAVRFYLASSFGNILLAVAALVLGVAVLLKAGTYERYWMVPVAGAAVFLAVVTLLLVAAGAVALQGDPAGG